MSDYITSGYKGELFVTIFTIIFAIAVISVIAEYELTKLVDKDKAQTYAIIIFLVLITSASTLTNFNFSRLINYGKTTIYNNDFTIAKKKSSTYFLRKNK